MGISILRKLLHPTQRVREHAKQVEWDMEYERLVELCDTTGGESSPFLLRLQKHIEYEPRKGNHET